MKALKDRILSEGQYLGNGILKVDGFLNHQLDPLLTMQMGEAFKAALTRAGVTQVDRIVTAESSGIAPGLATAVAYGVPLVFARKKRPVTMPSGFYSASAPSHTKGGVTTLMISPEYVHAHEEVLIIDDFLASGKTTDALVQAVTQSGASVCGIGAVIEKSFEGGRERLNAYGVPVVSLAIIERLDDSGIVLK